MKTVNSLSGGKTSSYIAVHYPADYDVFSLVCIDDKSCKPKDAALIQYVNDKLQRGGYDEKYGEFIATAEDDHTLYAMRDLEQYIGREITWVRGASFDKILDDPFGNGTRYGWLPSWKRRYCTEHMKLLPIFQWWFQNIGERVNMRIGFRIDEFARMERFFNNSDPCNFSVPVACSTKGQRRQRFENFLWRFCSFPLIRDGIDSLMIKSYWARHGWIGGSLFEERRQIQFPEISNCVGCFHKKPATLSVMANLHPEKMEWFARQEDKGMGTWLDSKIRYEQLIAHAQNWIPEMLSETAIACDSGGCTD